MNRSIRLAVPAALPLAFAALALTPPPAIAQQATGTTNPALSGGILMQQEETQKITSELIGLSLVDPAGSKIGRVSDLILDEERQVVGLVVSVGGLFGIGDKLVGLPWNAVSLEQGEDGPVAVAVSLSEEQLAAAPKFVTQAEVKKQQAEEAAMRRAEQERMQAQDSLEKKTPTKSE